MSGTATLAANLPVVSTGRLGAVLRPVLWLLLALAVVEAVVVVFGIRSYYLPRPSVIASTIMATPGAYLAGLWRTFLETVLGFLAGSIFGVVMAVLFHRWQTLRELFFPLFVVSQTIPVIAFGAVVVLWFGNTLFAKAVISFYISFLPVTVNTMLGFSAVDPRQVQLMRSFGAADAQILRRLYLPAALPQLFVALKLASSLALVGAIVGEWFGDTTGLGVLLLQAMYNENVAGIWATIVVSACLGMGLYGAVSYAERRIVFWGGEQ
ncbi:NitT/TauT family transport system permease protein [Rhizobium subbaraonis]|uniref:NitT/TauT family transport system permease protein n=1 Tax=Rhizobium subbaraonis TaxID=908946 RepID=A0A285UTP9_9HYPH|nr:ABC transporter permease [Rhizobium subbaraonis]SOC45305.1 NitT/TauT family transport system permease protein [Rhizobium subbaraonis]